MLAQGIGQGEEKDGRPHKWSKAVSNGRDLVSVKTVTIITVPEWNKNFFNMLLWLILWCYNPG